MANEAGYTPDQIMLTLAAITYRGYDVVLPEPSRRAAVYRATARSLDEFAPVRGDWDLVWGPASFDASFSGFDDAAMYVVRQRSKPSQYVIAVRGTHPLSLYDWVFGDFTVTRQVPWLVGGAVAGDAKISFSTALGMSILQHLRWQPGAGIHVPALWNDLGASVQVFVHAAAGMVGARLAPAAADAFALVRGVREQLAGQRARVERLASALIPDSVAQWRSSVQQRLTSATTRVGLQLIDQGLRMVDGTSLDPLRLVLGGSVLRSEFAEGVSLHEFLAAVLRASGGPLQIAVTGHSKGGALATTLALALRNAQGAVGNVEDRWDPDSKAEVSAYSFAGPTAGNAAFAQLSDQTIGARCRRVVNAHDIVPQAWAIAALANAGTTLGLSPADQATLQPALNQLVNAVMPLGYTPLEGQLLAFAAPRPSGLSFVEQFAHQHLQAYLDEAGLGVVLTTADVFAPAL